MSEENVELALRASELFKRKDLHGFLALMARDVRFQPQLGPSSAGHDGIRRVWNLLQTPDYIIEVVEVRDLGADLVLAVVRERGGSVGSAASFQQTVWIPSRWRQGECIWWGVFLTEQDALGALGLRG